MHFNRSIVLEDIIPFLKLIGEHFGVDVKRNGDHFGVDLGILSALGIISRSGSFRELYSAMTSNPKSPRTTGNEAAKVSVPAFSGSLKLRSTLINMQIIKPHLQVPRIFYRLQRRGDV